MSKPDELSFGQWMDLLEKERNKIVLNWDMPEEGEEEPYNQRFIEVRDDAIEKQKQFIKGSLIWEQYQVFIDVGNNVIEMFEDRESKEERRHQDRQNRLEESEAWGNEFPELK